MIDDKARDIMLGRPAHDAISLQGSHVEEPLVVAQSGAVFSVLRVHWQGADSIRVPSMTSRMSVVTSVQPASGFELLTQHQRCMHVVPNQWGYLSMYFLSFWCPWSHPAVWQQQMSSQAGGYQGGPLSTSAVGDVGASPACCSSDLLQANTSRSGVLEADPPCLDVKRLTAERGGSSGWCGVLSHIIGGVGGQ